MSNETNNVSKPSLAFYLWVLAIFATIGYAAVYLSYGGAGNGLWPASQSTSSHNRSLTAFVYKKPPTALPKISFLAKGDKRKTLQDFAGKVVLLNLWATWCGPCKEEMPSLDRLQTRLSNHNFEVVALNLNTDVPESKSFLEKWGAPHLNVYADPSASATQPLGIKGMPTTLLINAAGREIGRLEGPAEWDSPEALQLISKATGVGANGVR